MTPPFHSHLQAAFEEAGGRPLAQAATVSAGGLPEVRTVVLRHLGKGGDPSFASDARSAKFEALAARSWLELCLWRPDAGIQLRLLGRASTCADDDLALGIWRALPLESRALFFSEAPGRPLQGGAAPEPPLVEEADGPPASFAVIRIVPERFERLVLGPPLQRRRWTVQDGNWRVRDLIP